MRLTRTRFSSHVFSKAVETSVNCGNAFVSLLLIAEQCRLLAKRDYSGIDRRLTDVAKANQLVSYLIVSG